MCTTEQTVHAFRASLLVDSYEAFTRIWGTSGGEPKRFSTIAGYVFDKLRFQTELAGKTFSMLGSNPGFQGL
jgi:hypothetical protein